MSFEVKLALFWLGVYLLWRCIRAAPGSTLTRLALTWFGPTKRAGERLSRYRQRQAAFALGWLAQLLAVAALLVLARHVFPALSKSDEFIGVTGFALAIGLGMALLGALLAGLGALKARWLGPDPIWQPPVETDADDDSQPSGPDDSALGKRP